VADPVNPRTPIVVWAVPAVLALGSCLPGAVHAVLWQDELATLSAVSRSLPDLGRLLLHRDAVHGLYYLLVQATTAVAGAGPVTVRLPAAIGAALWAGLVAVLGARLGGHRVGLLAGLLLAVVPAVSRFGAEARPYTLAAAAAAGCTLAFVLARERGGRRAWAWYAASIVLTGYLQLTAVLVVGAHALLVAYRWRQDRQMAGDQDRQTAGDQDRQMAGDQAREQDQGEGGNGRESGGESGGQVGDQAGGQAGSRRLLRPWALATGSAAILLLPLIVLAAAQSGAVGEVPGPTWRSVIALPVAAFFAPAAGALLVGLSWPALARRDDRTVLLGAFALLPFAVIVLVSLHTSLMRPRYLLFTVAAWALLAALALAEPQRGPGRRAALAGLLAVTLLGLSQHVDQLAIARNGQPDYRAMAATMAPLTRPGDAMVLPDARGIRFRIGLAAYLPPDRRPADVLAVTSPAEAASLDAGTCDPAACLGTPPRLWVGCVDPCADPLSSITAGQRRVIAERGYRIYRRWIVPGGAISVLSIPTEH
jgi:mannosyltransferase